MRRRKERGAELLLLFFLDEVVIPVGATVGLVADGATFKLSLERIGTKHDVLAGITQIGSTGRAKDLNVLFGEHTLHRVVADACAYRLVDCLHQFSIEYANVFTETPLVDSAKLFH